MGTDPGVLGSLLPVKAQHHRKTGRCQLDAVYSGCTGQVPSVQHSQPCLALWGINDQLSRTMRVRTTAKESPESYIH